MRPSCGPVVAKAALVELMWWNSCGTMSGVSTSDRSSTEHTMHVMHTPARSMITCMVNEVEVEVVVLVVVEVEVEVGVELVGVELGMEVGVEADGSGGRPVWSRPRARGRGAAYVAAVAGWRRPQLR